MLMKETLTRTAVLLACFAPFTYDLANGVMGRGLIISGAFSLLFAFFTMMCWPLSSGEKGSR